MRYNEGSHRDTIVREIIGVRIPTISEDIDFRDYML